jgi:DNA-binding MarR family transcriptional regulator
MTGTLSLSPDILMTAPEESLMCLVAQVRRCFWRLNTIRDAGLADRGVTASQRAILEHLTEHGRATVPKIAAHKSVTRQSIQVLVDQLLGSKLVVADENPAHERSPLIALTSRGRAVFLQIMRRDLGALRKISSEFEIREIAAAEATLKKLQSILRRLTPGDPDDQQ